MMYFNPPIETIEELKMQYRDLIKKNHPDLGGSNEAMKEINIEYEKLFKQIEQGLTFEARKENRHTINDGFREILEKVIFLQGVKIEIIGSWIWISGNTFAVSKQIKDAGFRFSNIKKSWYWYNGIEKSNRKYKGRYTMNELRKRHGVTTVETEEQKKLKANIA